jgi:1-acyl-sn-glycerol-3-phosphate acyltransferase
VRRRFARLCLRVSRWHAVGRVPHRGVLVGAPHTSNWDFVLMLLLMWNGGVTPRVLVKKELFVGPLGWLLRRLGAVPIDRARPGALVRDLIAQARSGEDFLLILAAEGTRRPTRYWKSGFYRIARSADLPVSLGFVDGPTRTLGFGPTLCPTDDVRADMEVIRTFYADKRGVHPDDRAAPRLREEDAAPGRG